MIASAVDFEQTHDTEGVCERVLRTPLASRQSMTELRLR
jgi:hypothetical protein